MQFHGKFEVARIPGASNRAEGGRAETPIGVVQRRRVCRVECFRSKLYVVPLSDPERFADHQINILQTGPTNRIPRAVTQRELGRIRECPGIKPAAGAAVSDTIRIADAVRPLYREAKARIVICCLRNRYCIARLHSHQSTDLPARDLP